MDEDLAIARALNETKKPLGLDTDAEEMIKILLEHIDNDSEKQQQQQVQALPQQNEECDLCIAFQEAYDNILTEKDQIVQVLNNIERENQNLSNNNQETSKIIEQFEMEIHANELDRQRIDDQLKTALQTVAALQSENLSNQRIINDLKSIILKDNVEMKDIVHQLNNLVEQVKAEIHQICHGLLYIFNGNQQRKFLKRYRESFAKNCQTAINDSTANDTTATNTNEYKSIVPYCGDIDSWDYIMIPVLKKL